MKDHVKQVEFIFSFIHGNIVMYFETSESLKWIINVMVRVKMNSSEEPPPTFESPSVDGNAPTSTQPTNSSDQ
jgi:hypothetical protein